MIAAAAFKVYTVASYRHLHAVRLIQARMRRLHGLAVLDWLVERRRAEGAPELDAEGFEIAA